MHRSRRASATARGIANEAGSNKEFSAEYREAGLAVRRRRKRHGVMIEREQLALPGAPNEVWSIDFVMDALSNGRRVKCLTAVDDFTKEADRENQSSERKFVAARAMLCAGGLMARKPREEADWSSLQIFIAARSRGRASKRSSYGQRAASTCRVPWLSRAGEKIV